MRAAGDRAERHTRTPRMWRQTGADGRRMHHRAHRMPPRQARAARTAGMRFDAIAALFELPFNALLFRAQEAHRAPHAPNAVQLSTLVSIKTGGCPEDCGYCPQAARSPPGANNEAMLDVTAVVTAARAA